MTSLNIVQFNFRTTEGLKLNSRELSNLRMSGIFSLEILVAQANTAAHGTWV